MNPNLNEKPGTSIPLSATPCSVFAVYHDGKFQAAYPRKLVAEVYSSGFSGNGKVEIKEGTFTPNAYSANTCQITTDNP